MKIKEMYLEDGVIVMTIEGFSDKIYLDNHVDNRRLMREFNANKRVLIFDLSNSMN